MRVCLTEIPRFVQDHPSFAHGDSRPRRERFYFIWFRSRGIDEKDLIGRPSPFHKSRVDPAFDEVRML